MLGIRGHGETHVSARAVKLAVILDVEVDDVHGSAAVVLNNLVGGVVSTTANDPGLLASHVVLDGNGVLTDVLEPHELEVAGTTAVHALSLVRANNDVTQGGAGVKEEDGVGVAWGWLAGWSSVGGT